jgi:ketosteroid isomerase-like protein
MGRSRTAIRICILTRNTNIRGLSTYNIPMIIPLLLIAFALQTSANATNKTTELLRAKDQALLDAIAPGDRKVWEQALAADAVFVDENGVIRDRAEFLKQLEPLSPGASGTLKITSYSAHISGDLATVVHIDDEQENYHGQMLSSRYLTTETWHREGAEWKLYLMSHLRRAQGSSGNITACPGAAAIGWPVRRRPRSCLLDPVGRQATGRRPPGPRDETVGG